jgi:P-type E1-E2 ATPase
MDRLIQANVIATSGRAVEAAGDVDVLLLDKTGTITLGNRRPTEFLPRRASEEELADAAPARVARRRDARGPQHRRARQGEARLRGARRRRARRHLRPRSPRRRA